MKKYFVFSRSRNSAQKTTPVQGQKMLIPLKYFSGECLFVHGEKDPETPIALDQITRLCEMNQVPYKVHIIPGANHSFYSLNWEKSVFGIIEDWLDRRQGHNSRLNEP